VRDRQLAEQLERLGWVVAQVWSAAAFLDPDAEAERVRRVVMAVRDARVGVSGGVPPAAELVVPQVLDD
jgi:G:T-mismatch repair DNA endonuclease (very short patch repair protein)